MSSLVLLNSQGVVARKLHLVSLPENYQVPEGMMVSWRTSLHVSSRDPLASMGPREPVLSFFYLGAAQAQVHREGFQRYEKESPAVSMRYGSRFLTVTVQGTVAKDVMALRDQVMHLINKGIPWQVSNDLNPKPGWGKRIFKALGLAS